MKVTAAGGTRAKLSLGGALDGAIIGAPAGYVATANGSNGAAWSSNVQTLWANGSNLLKGPSLNIAAGSNIILTLDAGAAGSVPSNTVRIHAANLGSSSFAPIDSGYLVTSAVAALTNEVAVGSNPGGELAGTWAAPEVAPVHSGSAHTVPRETLAGATRLTAATSLRVTLANGAVPFKGAYAIGSVSILDDTYVLQYKRATLNGNARVTLAGTGELFVFDLAPVGRLVLAGVGG